MLTVIRVNGSEIRDVAMDKQRSGSPPTDCDAGSYQKWKKVPRVDTDAMGNSTFPMYLLHSASYKMLAKLIDDQTTTSRDQGHGTNRQRPMWRVGDQNHNAWREKRIDGRYVIFHLNSIQFNSIYSKTDDRSSN